MYRFTPILKTLVWGTESWVLSGVPGDESMVAEGPEAGKKITDIYPGQFPLLIKFIDTKQDLSVQVHPDDKLAMARYGLNGKTEMWYVIGAAPGAKLLSGLKEQITPDDYVRLVEEDRITDVLAEHKVAPGDVFFLPAGRIHAIGGGCFLAEIQQTSDLTYRIYDYNRPGLDGKPRQLHTQEAKDAIDYRVYPEYRTRYEMRRDAAVELVRCPYFTTELFELTREMEIPGGAGDDKSFLILIGIAGQVRLRTAQDETVLSAGEAVLVPATDGALSALPLLVEGDGGSASFLTTHL
ncbi:MAG: class I mannose-6-phosphate isomerase [Bacteroidales bacterium]|nr:class I mannose-6-phosphate isomerase [Bacteroidales bacterium]